MEIELPDGTILEAPDDADPKKVVAGYRQNNRKALEAKYKAEVNNPTEGMSTDDKFAAGLASGVARVGRGAVNLALPDFLTPKFASDENIKNANERDKALGETWEGGTGQFLGEAGATAPLGAVSAPLKGIRGASVLARALRNPATRAAVEGAVASAATANPGERGASAAMGGVMGGGLSGVAQGGGRLLKGLVKKSQAAQDVQHIAAQHGEDIFLPISQAADDKGISGAAKFLYKEALPVLPLTKGRLNKQGEQAAEKLREIALRDSLPPGMALPKGAGDDVSSAVTAMKTEFDKAYDDTVKSYVFNLPTSTEIVKAIQASAPKNSVINKQTVDSISESVDKIMSKFSDGKPTIDGTNLLNAKREIGDLIAMAKGDEKGPIRAAQKILDDVVDRDLTQGGSAQNLADLQKYKDLTPAWRAFRPVKEAAEAIPEKDGQFTFRALARKAKNSPEQRLLGKAGFRTVDQPASGANFPGRTALGLAGVAGIGGFGSIPAAATIMGIGHGLVNKSTQKALMGDTTTQQALVRALRKIPGPVRSGVRNALVSDTTEDMME